VAKLYYSKGGDIMRVTPDCCILCDGNYGIGFWEEAEKRRCNWNVFYPVKKKCCKRCSDSSGRKSNIEAMKACKEHGY